MIAALAAMLKPRSRGEAARLAREAEEWLGSDAVNIGIARLRKQIIEKWLQSDDAAVREQCWWEYKRLNALLMSIRTLVDEEQAQQRIEKDAQQQERAAKGDTRHPDDDALRALRST